MGVSRKSVPPSLQVAGRRASVEVGRRTAGMRHEPDFIVVGASRSGTTSLFRALLEHPQILRPTFYKGVNYFDLNYFRGRDWYRGHFPLKRLAARATARAGSPVVFEASGYYLYHPFAMHRLARDLPHVKVVAMLRDPVERAYSAYQHESSRGFEWEDFETAVRLEEDRLVGEVDRMRRDPTYESFSHRHHAYLGRGAYATQLERVFDAVPRDRVHIMDSARFFASPDQEFTALMRFLGLTTPAEMTFKRYNAEPRSPMTSATHARLVDHFRDSDERLRQLLGWTPSWIS